ncbi:MAG: PhoH-like ATPase [Deferribacteres bacterium]|jgi:PhoH-like ATPase|nr:PhoH family protein [Deferribacteraceae bacterium]MDK2793255.1 PhoH-like ATPase [Deferribacteres bacterium]
MKKKTFILDTNVLLHSPDCLETFQDNDILIPAICIEELDKFKNYYDLKGFYAREFIRNLEKIRGDGDLISGINMQSGGRLYIRYLKNDIKLPIDFENNKSDNIILKIVLESMKEFGQNVIFVSKDINLRIKANLLGINSEDYYHHKSNTNLMASNDTLFVDDFILDILFEKGFLDANYISEIIKKNSYVFDNRYFLLKSNSYDKKSTLIKYDCKENVYRRFGVTDYPIGVVPTNYQQKFFLDALTDPDIKIIFAIGIAGTGKTLLSISSGLTQVLNKKYKKLIISRSPVPMGRELGYLPGDLHSKLDPWLKPVYDNIEFILSNVAIKESIDVKNNISDTDLTLEYLKSSNIIEVEGLTYIRGRTFHNSFIIIDESQNLTPHEVKTIITRVGKNSKIVLTGDIYQIDNPFVDEKDNGLVYASERFKNINSKMAITITMTKCERSELSKLAASIL